MRPEVTAIGRPSRNPRFQGGPEDGISWRHVATLVLLLVTLPLFLTAGVAAVALLPVVLGAMALDRVRQLVQQPARARARR